MEAALKRLAAVIILAGVLIAVITMFIAPIATPEGWEPTGQAVTSLNSKCTTWRVTGMFIDIYMPKGLSGDFGMLGDDCTDVRGRFDASLCRTRCLHFHKILEYCNPKSGGFGMYCVEGGASHVRLTLEGG